MKTAAVKSLSLDVFESEEHNLIHQYKNNGYNIVLDVNSGAVHVVDDIGYDVILVLNEWYQGHGCEKGFDESAKKEIFRQLGSRVDESELEEIYNEVLKLVESGRLFTEDTYRDYIREVIERKTVVKALCLHIAHDCNLACKYCFAEEGEYHGRRALMTFEVGRKALDFLIENSGSRRNLEVDFFGGEPLMNWDVVKELVYYGRKQETLHHKHFRFTVTTNGVLLNDDIQAFINEEMDNVVLSLDGRKEINDDMRPFRNGRGSYELIVPKFQAMADSRDQERYYIRGTFTRKNLDFSEDVKHFAKLGFKQMSIEPVVGDDDDPYAIQVEDLPQIFTEYDKLAKFVIKREKSGEGFNFFHFMIDLEGGPCVAKRLSGCGSGTEYLAVTPWGDFYPCHQFVGQDEFLMGNVDTGVIRPDIAEEFRGCNVYTKEKCEKCFAKFYCSGGCMANAYNFHGSIYDAYDVGCEMQRKRVESAIMIQAALADGERN